MKGYLTKYKIIFYILLLFIPLLLKKYRFRTDRLEKTEEPFLMLANHTTESDFLMASYAAGRPVRFVCGEHLFRGRFGTIMQWLADPIALPKGASAVSAVKEILRRIKQGENILLFPEGNRSFNGETTPAKPALGKLIKRSGAALVTYRIQGGYFVAPRWAYRFRKGPVEGHIVHTYSASELRNMSADEITESINRDLYENAYATQEINPRRYKGKALAEGLENYLLICPNCGAYDSMETSGNCFRCRHCSMEGVYDEQGFLQGKDLHYHTVYDWGKWIEQRFDQEQKKREKGELLFTEADICLSAIDPINHCSQERMTGSLKIYRNRFEIGEHSFLFAEITDMAMLYFGKSLLFTCGKDYYSMTGPVFHAWKADRLFRLFKAEKAAD